MTILRKPRNVQIAFLFGVLCSIACNVASQNIDLATFGGPTGFKVNGAAPGDNSGWLVSNTGDMNKDGVDDVIIGAYTTDVGTRTNAGAAFVIFGRKKAIGSPSFGNIDLAVILAAGTPLGFAILGATAGDIVGQSVGGAGDVNGDGIFDVIVGAFGVDRIVSGNLVADVGCAYVIFGRDGAAGSSSYANIDLTVIDSGGTELGFSILGASFTDYNGWSVSGAGDVNGDKLDDVVIGALNADHGSKTENGASYVIFGRSKAVNLAASYANIDLATFANGGTPLGFAVWGAGIGDNSGISVSGAGDVNKDGLSDIIIGSPNAELNGRTDCGVSYVIFGRKYDTGANSYANIDLSVFVAGGSPLGFPIIGSNSGDYSGYSVSDAGDVNGDQIDDFLVGAVLAEMNVAGVINTGGAFVVFGRTAMISGATGYYTNVDLSGFGGASSMGYAIYGVAQDDFTGFAVSAAGDLNGDGVGDVIVGAYKADPVVGALRDQAGITYVVFGRHYSLGAAARTNIDLTSFAAGTAAGFRIIGAAAYDNSGISVSAAGDVNYDGIDDIIVGASGVDAVGVDFGATYVIFGTIGLPTSQPSSQPSRQPTARPSRQPSSQPTAQPTQQPQGRPSARPSLQPQGRPTSQPTCQPSQQPTRQPISIPSSQPSSQPTSSPTCQPSTQPSMHPSTQPSQQPSALPSTQPSACPSSQPTARPTCRPSRQPTSQPSSVPSCQPSSQPSGRPSVQPSTQPTCMPSTQPSIAPSTQPSVQPSGQPTDAPSTQPSAQPSTMPSMQPSAVPTTRPSSMPTVQPTAQPRADPSAQPLARPSSQPTGRPSAQPAGRPSSQPTSAPSTEPSSQPNSGPTTQPTGVPSARPSSQSTCRPSAQPSNQPSSKPSMQPSSAPSTQPSSWPSVQPTSIPSAQPSARPSLQPTSRPSATPSTLPTAMPSIQPSSVPSGQPSCQPSSIPTTQPTSRPSSAPSSQPTSAPSSQPSQQPSTVPSGQPSSSPTARPTLSPTGEWIIFFDQEAQLKKVAYAGGYVWACGSSNDMSKVVCVLTDAVTGVVVTQYALDWDMVTSVLSIIRVDSVTIGGQSSSGEVKTTEVASCVEDHSQLQCSVTSFHDSHFTAVSYVQYAKKLVYVGWYNIHTTVTVIDPATALIQSYMYTASNMKAIVLSQVTSPPYFVGGFVAGTTIRATAAPVNYIVAGMVRTEAGIFSAMVLMPLSGDIINSADLVTSMALDALGPDSFIAGALQLSSDTGQHAYVVRANALFMSVQYCVRYRNFVDGRRRTLHASNVSQSVVRGIVLVETVLFLVVDHTHRNVTSLTVLKTRASDAAIIKQVHVTAPNGTSLHCTDLTQAGELLSIVCSVQVRPSSVKPQSLLLAIDQDLSLAVLPVGFIRSEEEVFHAENVPFKRTVLTITKTSTAIPTSTYEFNTADNGPTRRPSAAPSYVPSSQPTSAPSAQPSCSPTAAPSVSAHPTSQPSSASPTNTHKPTEEPSLLPTRKPSVVVTARPSFRSSDSPSVLPTVQPSAVPTIKPSTRPTERQSVAPLPRPSMRPTTAPSRKPTSTTMSPSAVPSLLEDVPAKNQSDRSRMPPYVVGASVGGGLGLLLIGYFVYQYYQNDREAKARELRKAEYYRQQAILVAQSRAETAKYIQEENDRFAAFKLEKELRREERRATQQSRGGGAYATGPVQQAPEVPIAVYSATSSSDVPVSSLHSSEMSKPLFSHVRSDHAHANSASHSESASWAEEEERLYDHNSELNSSEYSEFVDFIVDGSDSSGSDKI